MKKKEWNEGLDRLDADLVEKYVEQKDQLRQKKRSKTIWLRIGAAVACFALVVSAIVVLPMLTGDDSGVPTWDDARYSAKDISELFGSYKVDAISTNAYTKIYVPHEKYLHIDEIPDDKYLGVYQHSEEAKELDKNELRDFISGILPKLSESIGVTAPKYEIKERDYSFGKSLSVHASAGHYQIMASQYETYHWFLFYSTRDIDRKIIIDGETVQIDQRLSDEEIIKSIKSIKNKLFDIFNVSFPDVKILRSFGTYSDHGAEYIDIYFYNESAHPLNKFTGRPMSDFIVISFDNSPNYADDIVSDDILTVSDIQYKKNRTDIAKECTLIGNAKRISLKEAEALLYKGYVFGGHSCPLCMAEQEKISFDGYDFVDIAYVFGYDDKTSKKTVGIPFYAFYKKIGTAENGNLIYAMTYVAAIEVSGYREYFESQKDEHQKNPGNYEIN